MRNYDYSRAILARPDLTATETLVALVMLSHRNSRTGLCYPSQATIAREAKLSRRAVNAAIRGLRDKGIVSGQQERGQAIQYQWEGVTVVRRGCERGAHKQRINSGRDKYGPAGEYLPEQLEADKATRARA